MVVHSVLSRRITPRLRHVDIPICYLHHKHGNGLHEAKSVPSRINFSNVGIKPESGPHLMRSSFLSKVHVHVRQLPQEQYDILTSLAPLSCYNHIHRD